jgi:hypothetical protein
MFLIGFGALVLCRSLRENGGLYVELQRSEKISEILGCALEPMQARSSIHPYMTKQAAPRTN